MYVLGRPIAPIEPYEHNPRVNDAAADPVAAPFRACAVHLSLVVDEAGVLSVGPNQLQRCLKTANRTASLVLSVAAVATVPPLAGGSRGGVTVRSKAVT
jgi:hypothetical protein